MFVFVIGDLEPYTSADDQAFAMLTHLELSITMIGGLAGEAVQIDGAQVLVAVVVILPVTVILAVLIYGVIDPEYQTWLALKCIKFYKRDGTAAKDPDDEEEVGEADDNAAAADDNAAADDDNAAADDGAAANDGNEADEDLMNAVTELKEVGISVNEGTKVIV